MYDEIPDYRNRLIDYVGDGFVIGSSLGSPFHFIRGLCNSRSGGRLAGGVYAVRTNVPRFAGKLAGRLAVFWALESGMSLARRREDKWNSIVAGTGTFALINIHRGARAATRSSLLAAIFFVGIELADLSFQSWHSGLVRSGREMRMQVFLPALVPIRRVSPCRAALGDAAEGSVECRPEKDAIPDIFAMGRKPKMTPKEDI